MAVLRKLAMLFIMVDKDNVAWSWEYLHNWIIPSFSLLCKLLLGRSYYFNIMLTKIILYLKFFLFHSRIWLCLHASTISRVYNTICNPTIVTEVQATWSPGLLLQLYFGVAVQEYMSFKLPPQSTFLYIVKDPRALSQIGSICMFESSILTSVPRHSLTLFV